MKEMSLRLLRRGLIVRASPPRVLAPDDRQSMSLPARRRMPAADDSIRARRKTQAQSWCLPRRRWKHRANKALPEDFLGGLDTRRPPQPATCRQRRQEVFAANEYRKG